MSADFPGRVIADKYKLLELVGRGGMATVWRSATHGAEGFERPVAIKRVHRELARSSDFIQMFIEEARVGSQLHHPNIVQIHDFGCDESKTYYLVMEWVEGLDLTRLAWAYAGAELTSPWALMVAIVVDVLRGLDAAHQRLAADGAPAPVYHRDVTPHNMLVASNGHAKLTDFGLARAMDRARMTDPDIIKGKLGYQAPELTFGKPASAQSDLYSIGVVLWEVLAGRKLFTGSDLDVLLGVRKAEIPTLASLRPDMPTQLSELVAQVLASDPALRPATAYDLERGLSLCLREADPIDPKTIANAVGEARERLTNLPPAIAPPDAG